MDIQFLLFMVAITFMIVIINDNRQVFLKETNFLGIHFREINFRGVFGFLPNQSKFVSVKFILVFYPWK